MSLQAPLPNMDLTQEGHPENLKCSGGFFPVGENNVWHSGIHLSSGNQVIQPMADGEIIAYRLSSTYIDEKLSRGVMFGTEDDLPKLIHQNTIMGIPGDLRTKLLGYYKEQKQPKDIYTYVLPSELANESKRTLRELVNQACRYSNNFVLMKHTIKVTDGSEQIFYSLYMHLLPWSQDLHQAEAFRMWYRVWAVKIANHDMIPRVKVYNQAGTDDRKGLDIRATCHLLNPYQTTFARWKGLEEKLLIEAWHVGERPYICTIPTSFRMAGHSLSVQEERTFIIKVKNGATFYGAPSCKAEEAKIRLSFNPRNSSEASNPDAQNGEIAAIRLGMDSNVPATPVKVLGPDFYLRAADNYEQKTFYVETTRKMVNGEDIDKHVNIVGKEEPFFIPAAASNLVKLKSEQHIFGGTNKTIPCYLWNLGDSTGYTVKNPVTSKRFYDLPDPYVEEKTHRIFPLDVFGIESNPPTWYYNQAMKAYVFLRDPQGKYGSNVSHETSLLRKGWVKHLILARRVACDRPSKGSFTGYSGWVHINDLEVYTPPMQINRKAVDVMDKTTDSEVRNQLLFEKGLAGFSDASLSWEYYTGKLPYQIGDELPLEVRSEEDLKVRLPETARYFQHNDVYMGKSNIATPITKKFGPITINQSDRVVDCTQSPIKITRSDYLGFGGHAGPDQNCIHLEVFTATDAFLKNPNSLVHHSSKYRVPRGFTGFVTNANYRTCQNPFPQGMIVRKVETIGASTKLTSLAQSGPFSCVIPFTAVNSHNNSFTIAKNQTIQVYPCGENGELPSSKHMEPARILDAHTVVVTVENTINIELENDPLPLQGYLVENIAFVPLTGPVESVWVYPKELGALEPIKDSTALRIQEPLQTCYPQCPEQFTRGQALNISTGKELIFLRKDFIVQTVDNRDYLGFPLATIAPQQPANPDPQTNIAWVPLDSNTTTYPPYTLNSAVQPSGSSKIIVENPTNWYGYILFTENNRAVPNGAPQGTPDNLCDVKSLVDYLELKLGSSGLKKGTLEAGEVKRAMEHSLIGQQMRHMIVKHPVEWQKETSEADFKKILGRSFHSNDQPRLDRYKRFMEKLEFASAVRGFKEQPLKDWYFVHPIAWVNKMLLAHEINPYQGATFSLSEKGGELKTVVVGNSPGFAPLSTTKTKYSFEGRYFPEPSGLFDQDYLQVSQGKDKPNYSDKYDSFRHKGVDFTAPLGTDIISFIDGKVIAGGYFNNNYGQIMIIKDAHKPIVYFLAHLSEILLPDDAIVQPNVAVAKVGGMGSNKNPKAYGYHLHMEVWKHSGKVKLDFVDILNDGYIKYREPPALTSIRTDPFDHSQPTHKPDVLKNRSNPL